MSDTNSRSRATSSLDLTSNTNKTTPDPQEIRPFSNLPGQPDAAVGALDELEAIYATIPVGLCVLDTELRYVRINERLAEINGHSVAEHLGKTVREIVPDLADEAEPILRRILETGEPVLDLEIRGKTAVQPGVERVWKENWFPLIDSQGAVIGINIVAEEITEQKQAEAALQESQTQYYQLFEAMDDGFCVCELLLDEEGQPYDYRFLEVNPAFEDHSGLKEAAGKTAYQLIPSLELYWLETFSKVALMDERIRFEQRSEALGRWFELYAFPFGPPDSRQFAIQFKDITARKQAEKALQESETRFRSFANNAPALLWVTDPAGQCTYLSQAWYDYTGQTEEIGLGLGWLEAVHPDDRAASGDIFLKANEQQISFQFEYRLRQRSGDYRWAIDAGTPRHDEKGEYLGYVGSVTDIHDRKVAEEALALSKKEIERQQQQLQTLFEQAPVAIVAYRGPEHIIELVNLRASELWGAAVEELINRPMAETLPEVQKQAMQDLLDKVMHSGEPFVGNEFPIVFDRDGKSETRYFDFVYEPWRDEHDAIIGVIAMSIDVSQRVVARQQEYKLVTMLDNSSDFIGLASPEGQGIYINPAGLEMVGLKASESVLDLKIADLFSEEDLIFVQKTILPAVLEKGKWAGETRLRHFQTGQAIPVLYNSFAVRDPVTDELLGLATITIDIRERKQREAELQHYREQLALTNQELATINEEMAAANEELRASNEELSDTNGRLARVNADLDNFVYTASHDLKAPISNIQGLLDLLEKSLSPESQASPHTRKVLSMMEKSTERFMRTILDLSDIARLQRQGSEPEELMDLLTVIEEVRLDIASLIEQADAQLDVEVEGCGPIRFSPKNLRSIAYNLVSNAVKYHDPERQPLVRIRCEETEDYQVLTVADNGLGMDLSKDNQLFGLFRRLHTHVEGTGIGLYIVKKIIENAGGMIEVESEVGVGTTFRVFFRR